MSNQTDPRIAKKEMIVTRNKARQQQRHTLRQKDGKFVKLTNKNLNNVTHLMNSPNKTNKNMTNINHLMKSPNKTNKNLTNINHLMKSPNKTNKGLTDSLLRSPNKTNKNFLNIINLNKQPKKVYRNSRKRNKQPQQQCTKNTEILNLEQDGIKEYYPDKLRRKFEEKRIFLKPKYESHTVVKLNKRKMGTPQRGVTLEDIQSSELEEDWSFAMDESDVFADLSMEEVVRIVEETESLDDEDLMEILTCPSPVWWEDPPDENYVEDPIYTRSPENVHKSSNKTMETQEEKANKESPKINVNKPKNDNEKPAIVDCINVIKADDKFMKKRSKLENVLGNIKNKTNTGSTNTDIEKNFVVPDKTVNVTDKNTDIAVINTDVADKNTDVTDKNTDVADKNIDVADKNIDVAVKNTNAADKNSDVSDKNTDVADTNIGGDIYTSEESNASTDVTVEKRKEKRNSESTESSFPDLCFNNEEMLRDLENMDIPIDISSENEDTAVERSTEEKKEPTVKNIEAKSEIDSESSKPHNITLAPNIPLNLPRLTKRPKLKLQESPSVKSLSDETDMSSTSCQENIDTISDTNIKFIIDDDIEMPSDCVDPIKQLRKEIDTDDKNKVRKTCTDVIKALQDKKEFITVYRIVSSDNKDKSVLKNKFKNLPEYSNFVENLSKEETSDDFRCNGQLNSFFKKCKSANRKKKNNSDNVELDEKNSFCDTCDPKKCITVARDENVKYCLNCSSIFDTDECSFCSKAKTAVTDEVEIQT